MVVKAVSSLSLFSPTQTLMHWQPLTRGSHWRGQKSIRRNGFIICVSESESRGLAGTFLMKAAIPASFTCAAFPSEAGENGSCMCQGHSNGQESDLNVKLLVQMFIVFKVYWTLQDRNELSCHVFKEKSPKNDIWSSFIHPHVVPNLCDFISFVEHKKNILKNCTSDSFQKGFLRIDPFVFHGEKKVIWVWNDMRVRKCLYIVSEKPICSVRSV